MPKFSAQLSDGRTVTIESDAPPTEADILAAINQPDLPTEAPAAAEALAVAAPPRDTLKAAPERSLLSRARFSDAGKRLLGVGDVENAIRSEAGMSSDYGALGTALRTAAAVNPWAGLIAGPALRQPSLEEIESEQRQKRIAAGLEPGPSVPQEPPRPVGKLEAGAVSATGAIVPTIAGAAGFKKGFDLAAPTARATRGIGPLVAGLIGAVGSGAAADVTQRKQLEQVAPSALEALDQAQQQQPVASAVGRIAVQAPFFKISPGESLRGAAALPAVVRGTATEAQKKAATTAALQLGMGTASGVAAPLAQGQLPTASGVGEAAISSVLFGQPRFSALQPGTPAARPAARPAAAGADATIPVIPDEIQGIISERIKEGGATLRMATPEESAAMVGRTFMALPDGTIVQNPDEVSGLLRNLDPKKHKDWAEGSVAEELDHVAVFQTIGAKGAKEFYNLMTPTEKRLGERIYYGPEGRPGDVADPSMLGFELINYYNAKLRDTPLAELTQAKGLDWLSTRTALALFRTIGAARRLRGTDASARQTKLLDQVQNKLAAYIRTQTGTAPQDQAEATPSGELGLNLPPAATPAKPVNSRDKYRNRGTGQPTPSPVAEAPTSATVPLMITGEMEKGLLARGFNQSQINRLTPQQANDLLAQPIRPAATAPAAGPDISTVPEVKTAAQRAMEARRAAEAAAAPAEAGTESGPFAGMDDKTFSRELDNFRSDVETARAQNVEISPETLKLLADAESEAARRGLPSEPQGEMPFSRRRDGDESPDDYVPALRPKGAEPIPGKRGQIHQDIYDSLPGDEGLEMRVALPEHGFINTKTGEFISRNQLNEKFGVVDSQGLRKLQAEGVPFSRRRDGKKKGVRNQVATGEFAQEYNLGGMTYKDLWNRVLDITDLRYRNQSSAENETRKLYNQIVNLNPELRNIEVNNVTAYGMLDVIAGVSSKFKADNIKYFIEDLGSVAARDPRYQPVKGFEEYAIEPKPEFAAEINRRDKQMMRDDGVVHVTRPEDPATLAIINARRKEREASDQFWRGEEPVVQPEANKSRQQGDFKQGELPFSRRRKDDVTGDLFEQRETPEVAMLGRSLEPREREDVRAGMRSYLDYWWNKNNGDAKAATKAFIDHYKKRYPDKFRDPLTGALPRGRTEASIVNEIADNEIAGLSTELGIPFEKLDAYIVENMGDIMREAGELSPTGTSTGATPKKATAPGSPAQSTMEFPFSRTRTREERNETYAKLVESPDENISELQRLVNEAARDAGYTELGYHGTKRKFRTFDSPRDPNKLIYFSKNREFAKSYPEGIGGHRDNDPDYQARIDAVREKRKQVFNPRYKALTEEYGSYDKVPDEKAEALSNEVKQWERDQLDGLTIFESEWRGQARVIEAYIKADKIFDPRTGWEEFVPVIKKAFLGAELTPESLRSIKQGHYLFWEAPPVVDAVFKKYDAMRIRESAIPGSKVDTIAVRDPKAIKSADAITYDESGKVIPLSERFDSSKSEYPYSRTRKKGDDEGQQFFDMAPLKAGERPPSAAEVEGTSTAGKVAPEAMEATAEDYLATDAKPSFEGLYGKVREAFGFNSPSREAVNELWMNSVWSHLNRASGKELRRLLRATGLDSRFNTLDKVEGSIADPPEQLRAAAKQEIGAQVESLQAKRAALESELATSEQKAAEFKAKAEQSGELGKSELVLEGGMMKPRPVRGNKDYLDVVGNNDRIRRDLEKLDEEIAAMRSLDQTGQRIRGFGAEYTVAQQEPMARRFDAISALANRMFRQAEKDSTESLTRKVTPEDVNLDSPSAFRSLEGMSIPEIVAIAAEGASGNRMTSKRKVVDGEVVQVKGKAAAPSETKRVIAIRNNNTGAVELLSTYQNTDKARTVLVVDPVLASLMRSKPHIPLETLLSQKMRDGSNRYTALESVLLRDPVKALRLKFKTQNDYYEDFANYIMGEIDQGLAAPEVAAVTEATTEKPPTRLGGILDNRRISPDEAGSLMDVFRRQRVQNLRNGMPVDESMMQDVIRNLGIRSGKDALTTADYRAIAAMHKAVLRTEAQMRRIDPQVNPDDAYEAALRTIYENANYSKRGQNFIATNEEFSSALLRKLGGDQDFEGTLQKAEPSSTGWTERQLARMREGRKVEGSRRTSRVVRQAEQAEATRRGTAQPEEAMLPEPPPSLAERAPVEDYLRGPIPEEPNLTNRQREAARRGLDTGREFDRRFSESAQPQEAFQGEPPARSANISPEDFVKGYFDGPASLRRGARSTYDTLKGAIGTPLSWYSEWLPDRIQRVGGRLVTNAVQDFRKIIDREKELYGGLSSTIDAARKEAGKAGRASRWANSLQTITPRTAVRNFVGAVEGTTPVPAYADNLIRLSRDANLEVGRLLQTVSPNFVASGKVQRNLTGLGFDIIRRGDKSQAWRDWTNGLAVANGIRPDIARSFFRRWKALLDDPDSDPSRVEKVNQDFARTFPKVVTDIKVGSLMGGRWEPVVHAEAFNYLENTARRATHVAAFRETYPATEAGRQNFRAMIRGLRSQIPGRYQPDVDALVRGLQGHPTDNYSSLGWLSADQPLGNASRFVNQTVGNLMARMVLTGQMVTQIPETVAGSSPAFLGGARYIRALAKTKQMYRELELAGARNQGLYDWSFDPSSPVRSSFRRAGNVLSKTFAQQFLNEVQEAAAAATARLVAEDITSGNLSNWDRSRLPQTFEMMGFSKAEAAEMIAGRRPDLMGQFQRKAAAFLTSGNKAVAEGSAIGGNRLFNSVFRFQSYAMMRTNQLRKLWLNMSDKMENGTPQEKLAAAGLMSRFIFGSAMQGTMAVALSSLVYGGLAELGTRTQEAKDEPFEFMAEAAMSAMSGPLYLVWRGAKDSGIGGITEQFGRLIFPYTMVTDLSDMVNASGTYRDLDVFSRIGKFVKQKMPGTRAISNALAATGLAQDNRELDSAIKGFYRWRREELGFTEREDYLADDTRAKFRQNMKRAVEALKGQDFDKYAEYLSAAAMTEGVTSMKQVNSSLRSRKILKTPNGTTLTPEQEESLRNRIGSDAVDRLIYFDAMLDSLAK